MATNNAVNTSLSGQTGTVSFVGSTSPTLVTPVLGVATATTIAFSPTTGGIVGTTTNDSPTAGNVGEIISSTVTSGSAVSLTTGTVANITSIVLTAGQWSVSGNVWFTGTATSYGSSDGSINTASATSPTEPGINSSRAFNPFAGSFAGNGGVIQGIPPLVIKVANASTTTVYLIGRLVFSGGTGLGYGSILATRTR